MFSVRRYLFSLLGLCASLCLSAQTSVYSSEVRDVKTDTPLSFVHITSSNGVGTYTNDQGKFKLESSEPLDSLRLSLVGYKTLVVPTSDLPELIYLDAQKVQLNTIEITGKKENLARAIIKRAILAKESFRSESQLKRADTYRQSHYEYYHFPSEQDSIDTIPGWKSAALYEEIAENYFDADKFKKIVTAELDSKADGNLSRGSRFAIDQDFQGSDQWVRYNPADVFLQPKDIFVDFQSDTWYNPNVADRPIANPVSQSGLLAYKFSLDSLQIDSQSQDTLFTIGVAPFFKQAAAYSGQIQITSNQYRMLSINLEVNSSLAIGLDSLSVKQEFTLDDTWNTPIRTEIGYTYKLEKRNYRCSHSLLYKQWDFTPEIQSNFFNSEVVVYKASALERDILAWKDLRPIAIDEDLIEFIEIRDSIYQYEHSPEYYRIQDSIYNSNSVVDFALRGFGWRNRSKGLTTSFNPIISWAQFNHIGGFRSNIGGRIDKELLSGNKLDVDYLINYGFRNNDLKGRLILGYTYLPRKFARLYGGIGNIYDVVTFNQTFEALFSPSNLIQIRDYRIGHAHELANGLFLDASAQYAIKEAIDPTVFPNWSAELFGSLNEAIDFETYISLFLNIELIYKLGQKYITRGPRKLLLSNSNPTIKLTGRFGIPEFFDSEVDFGKLQLDIFQRPKPTLIGSSNWKITLGEFIYKRDIREIEHQFFRGENLFLFSNPLNNLQLLDQTLNTNQSYFQAGIVHHFDGFILDKVPLLNRAQLEVVGGAAFFAIPKYSQFETYIGIGKKFKLFKETVQVAIFRTFAYDSNGRFKSKFALGANIYDPFNGQWAY